MNKLLQKHGNPPLFYQFFRKMKLTILIVTASILSCLSAETYSQTTKLTIVGSNSTLLNVIRAIEDQSEFKFFYNEKVDVNMPVSVEVTGKPVTDILDKVLSSTSVKYKVLGRQIALYDKDEMEPFMSEQQTKKVTGKVTDSNGTSIPGASVVVKGTTTGIVTDNNGDYSLSSVPVKATLQFSFVGMKLKEIVVGSKTLINVVLEEESIGLNEVVAIGYGTTTRKNLTTAISKIDISQVSNAANSNVNALLMGRAAGLQAFQGTAQPDGKINVSIRGGGDPLYVVDGVVMPSNALDPGNGSTAPLNSVNRSGMAGLNPEDIESVEVLKDASSAIYGIAAANGVILITTKKGKGGALSVSYDANHSWMQNYPYYKPLDAKGYMNTFNNFAKDVYMFDNGMGVYGNKTIDYSNIGGDANIKHALYTDVQIAKAGAGFNYLKSVMRQGVVDNHTFTFNGSNENVHYYFSGNYFNQKGTVVNSGLEKYSAHMNMDARFLTIFKFGANVNVNKNSYQNSTAGVQTNGAGQQSYGALQSAIAWPATINAFNPDGTFAVDSNLPNPLGLLGISDQTTSSGIFGNLTLEAEIIPGMLTAKMLYGENSETSDRSYHIPNNVFWDQMYLTRAALNNAKRNKTTVEGTVSFNKKFGSILNLSAVIGAGQYVTDEIGNGFSFSDFPDALGNYNAAAATGAMAISSYRNYQKERSYFGRATFDILDKYIITGTIRRDGDNRFFPQSKYASFPSVSAAWKLTNESFLKDNPVLNLLKLRGSYGITGSNNLGLNAYGIYQPSTDILSFNHGSTYYVTYLQNGIDYPNLTWQKQDMLNGGLDFSLFKGRISGSVDVFRNDITNLLTYANTSQLSFVTSQPVNGGEIINSGYEVNLNTVNIKKKDFGWNMSLTASHYYKHWARRFATDDIDKSYTGVKDAVDVIYYRPTSGIISDFSKLSSKQQAIQTALGATQPGYEIYKDTNGDGVVDNKDIKSVAIYPKLYLGWGNTFNYKSFDLDIYFYGQTGFKRYNHSYDWATESGIIYGTSSGTVDVNKIWTPFSSSGILPGYASVTHPVTIAAGTYNTGTYPNLQTMSVGTGIGLEDASFLRCRNITLGYNFNLPSLKKYVRGLKVFFDLQNAFILTSYKGIDPEVYESQTNGGGVKGGPGNYPMARTFSLGLKVNFN